MANIGIAEARGATMLASSSFRARRFQYWMPIFSSAAIANGNQKSRGIFGTPLHKNSAPNAVTAAAPKTTTAMKSS